MQGASCMLAVFCDGGHRSNGCGQLCCRRGCCSMRGVSSMRAFSSKAGPLLNAGCLFNAGAFSSMRQVLLAMQGVASMWKFLRCGVSLQNKSFLDCGRLFLAACAFKAECLLTASSSTQCFTSIQELSSLREFLLCGVSRGCRSNAGLLFDAGRFVNRRFLENSRSRSMHDVSSKQDGGTLQCGLSLHSRDFFNGGFCLNSR